MRGSILQASFTLQLNPKKTACAVEAKAIDPDCVITIDHLDITILLDIANQ
jgi:hypothetical protein